MNPARVIVRIFIDVFGITRPTPQQEERATVVIGMMLVITAIAFVGVAYAFFHY